MKGESLKGHLDMLVLSVLADGARHGYAIIDELRLRSDDVFDLAEGTVYPVLHRLERSGKLTSEWAGTGGRRRRSYKLTTAGRAKLAEDHARWKQISKAVAAVTASVGRTPWPQYAMIEASLRDAPANAPRRERRPIRRKKSEPGAEQN
jgi:transcriptional regulator